MSYMNTATELRPVLVPACTVEMLHEAIALYFFERNEGPTILKTSLPYYARWGNIVEAELMADPDEGGFANYSNKYRLEIIPVKGKHYYSELL